jgi:restriction system protein
MKCGSKDLGLKGIVLEETLASGHSKFENKVAWVRFALADAGYIDRSRRGVWALTEKGRTAGTLSDEQVRALLPEIQRKTKRPAEPGGELADGDEPEEAGYKRQLLDLFRSLPPAGFERLCQRLLRESDFEHVTVTGRSGDGGIDGHGVVKVNAFVSFKVLFQCKRDAGTVGSPQVRDFRGAMQGRADKGIILTTGFIRLFRK